MSEQDFQSGTCKRSKRKKNFTIFDNDIILMKGMSMDTKLLLGYCLNLPDDWVFHKSHLQKVFDIGRTAIDRMFDEMEKAGYLVAMDMIRNEKKQFCGRSYIFYDEPFNGEADARNPTTAEQLTETTQLYNINNNKEIYNNKEIQKKESDEEQFNQWWELYDYKVDKTKAMKSWAKMTDLERSEALSSVVWYVEATTTSNAPRDPLKPFIPKRKNPATWLNGRCWEDEAYKPKPNPYQEEIDRLDKLAKDKWDELLQWEQKAREQNTHFWDEIGALQREVKNANIMSKYWKDKWEVEKNSK